MAYPLKAYYGRKTIAHLDKCCFCGKPYAETGEWTTLCSGGEKLDLWFITCEDCQGKLADGDFSELAERMRGAR